MMRVCMIINITFSIPHLSLSVSLQEALKVMEFSEEEIRDMFKLLSGVLQLGDVEFMTAGGAQITTKQGENFYSFLGATWTFSFKRVSVFFFLSVFPSVLSNVSDLLGLDCFQLSEVLTQRSMILRGEEICSPLTVEQVRSL